MLGSNAVKNETDGCASEVSNIILALFYKSRKKIRKPRNIPPGFLLNLNLGLYDKHALSSWYSFLK
jgi:hypothetical protein